MSIMGFLRVPGAQKPCQKIASCPPLCETRGLCCATSFVNIEMTGEMEPRRPSVTKVLDIFQMDDVFKHGKLICVICLKDLLKGEQCHPL